MIWFGKIVEYTQWSTHPSGKIFFPLKHNEGFIDIFVYIINHSTIISNLFDSYIAIWFKRLFVEVCFVITKEYSYVMTSRPFYIYVIFTLTHQFLCCITLWSGMALHTISFNQRIPIDVM